MSKPIKIFWTCRNCHHENEINVTPVIPARTYGPPENCSPEEGGEIEPSECQNCGADFPQDECIERAAEKERETEERWADSDLD